MSHHFPGDDRNDLRGYIMHVEKNVAAHTPRIEALERQLTELVRVAGINAHLFDERVTALEKDRRPAVVGPVVASCDKVTSDRARDAELELVMAKNLIDRMSSFVDFNGKGRLQKDVHAFMGWDAP